jgi:hypothetical protein
MTNRTLMHVRALAAATVLAFCFLTAADNASLHSIEQNPGVQAFSLPASQLRFAAVGDYGDEGQPEADVAALVRSWDPEFILTLGDNNYPDGEASTIDANIGQYYHDFIGNYTGSYGPGAAENRFFPALGNHDWYTAGAQPYLDYFTFPAMSATTASPGGRRIFCLTAIPASRWHHNHFHPGELAAQPLNASTARWKLRIFTIHHTHRPRPWLAS